MKQLDRRTFLRGAAGATLALPLLDAMIGRARAEEAPKRFVLCSGGFSLGVERSTFPEALLPSDPGPVLQLSEELTPLAGVRDRVAAISGLRIPGQSADGSIPPGGRHTHEDGFHHHFNPLLSGFRQIGDARDPRVTGASPDERMAEAAAGRTLFRKLTWRAQPEFYYYDSVPEYSWLSYQQFPYGVRPVIPQTSPRAAWLELTGAFLPGDPGQAQVRLQELQRRRSVLDLVDRRASGLMDRLGERDRQRLERHYDELRALELQLSNPPTADGDRCSAPPDPGPDPGAEPGGWSDEDTRARTFNDLMRFALACDLSRSASLMYTFWKSYIYTQPVAGYAWTLHDVLHHGDRAQLVPMVRWHIDLWGDLLTKLAETPEQDGTLLDNTALVFLPEGGYGFSGGGDLTTSHSCENMVLLTAGASVGGGRHLVAPEGYTHPANVFISAMKAAGLATDTHGDIDGELPGLREG